MTTVGAIPSGQFWRGSPSPGLRQACLVGGVCGLVATLTAGPTGAAILLATLAAVIAGVLRPAALLPLIALATVVVPPYVGWLIPGDLFFNMQRGVMYGGMVGLVLWKIREAQRGNVILEGGQSLPRLARLAEGLLMTGWLLAPAIGMAHGVGNAFRALNGSLYQALPFWVGLRFASQYDRRQLMQVVFALLILYAVPYWVYELQFGKSLFQAYVPPIPGLLTGGNLLTRGGQIRVQSTFGHPLAFGQFLVLAMPLAASLAFVRRLRVLGLCAVVAGVTALWATHSRSPWLALIGGLLGTILIRRPRLAFAVAAIFAVLLMVTPLGDIVSPSALALRAREVATLKYSGATEEEFSAASRIFLTVGAIRAISQRPLVGYGVNATGTAAGIPSVDDYFLALPVEIGLPAAAPVFLGMLLMWVSLSRGERVGRAERLVPVAVGAYLTQLLFVGLHDTVPLLFLLGGQMSMERDAGRLSDTLVDRQAVT